MLINKLPNEIINQWVNKYNSKVCHLWHSIWCTRPMIIKLLRGNKQIICPLDILSSKLKNLVKLDLSSSFAINGSIGSLVRLKEINLCCNLNVTDKILKHLTNITSLSLKFNNTITDSSLKYLTNITKLFSNELITDNSLKYLTKINDLTLHDNKLISDESISCLTNITRLSIIGCELVTDMSVKKLINMTNIYLNNNNNITCASLKYLTNLKKMRFDDHKMDDKNLSKLTSLKSLQLDYGPNILGKSIRCLTRLEFLSLNMNGDIMTEDILKLTNLRKLYLENCYQIEKDKIKLPRLTRLLYF